MIKRLGLVAAALIAGCASALAQVPPGPGGTVIITGGSVNGTPIGATTPSTGAFTTLNASGNDALLYDNASGQSIANNTVTTVTGWTEVSDRVGANFNATTGTFTAPATGIYQVGGQITFAPTNAGVDQIFQARVVGNGVLLALGQVPQEVASSITTSVIIPMTNVALSAGQTIVIQAYQNTGSAVALNSTAQLSTLSINRLP